MEHNGVKADEHLYAYIVRYYALGGNFEMALQSLATMNSEGFTLPVKVAQYVIECALDIDSPKLALDIAIALDHASVHELPTDSWVHVLAACAQGLYVSTPWIFA